MSETAATILSGPAPGRECGACNLCCKLVAFPDVPKPAGKWCQHVDQGRGCKIHSERPETCRAFHCEWMLNGGLTPEWKPDRARFVMGTYPGTNALAIILDPGAPTAWRKEPYYGFIKQWARTALVNGSYVMVMNGSRVTIVLPTADADLGVLEPGDQINIFNDKGTFSAGVQKFNRQTAG